MKDLNIGCVIMASGFSKRFGENKLLYRINGKALIEHTLTIIPTYLRKSTIVVTQYKELENIACEYGYSVIQNKNPEHGQSESIKLGIEKLIDKDAILFLVGDQPNLKTASFDKIMKAHMSNPHAIIVSSCNGRQGNPVLFSSNYYKELLNLSGDKGGKTIIQRHDDNVILVELSKNELMDIDSKDDLKKT